MYTSPLDEKRQVFRKTDPKYIHHTDNSVSGVQGGWSGGTCIPLLLYRLHIDISHQLRSPAPGAARFGGLWQPVAADGCGVPPPGLGGLAACGNLWRRMAVESCPRGQEVRRSVAARGGGWRPDESCSLHQLTPRIQETMEYWKLQDSRPGLASLLSG